MTQQEQIQLAEAEADRLAAVAAEPAIAAGAADSEVGAAVLADHLAGELAVIHRMMMQLAATAGAVLDWPAGPANGRPAAEIAAEAVIDTTPAALAAARLAGGAIRLLEQVRQGLPVLALPQAATTLWEALAWRDGGCSEAELQRRFEAARAAAAETQPAARLSPGGRALKAAARASAAMLAAEAGAEHLACAIAATSGEFLRRIFAHELAAGHGLLMRLASRFDPALTRATDLRREPVAALRLAHATARISARLRRGRATLALVEAGSQNGPAGGPGNGGGKPRPSHNSFWGGDDGGYVPPGPESVAAAPAATAGHGVPSTFSRPVVGTPPSLDLIRGGCPIAGARGRADRPARTRTLSASIGVHRRSKHFATAGHGVDPTFFPAAAGATNPAAPGVDTLRSRFYCVYCAGAKKRVSECPPRVALAPTPPGLEYNFAAMG